MSKKILCLALAVVMLVGVLAGCGTASTATAETAATEAPAAEATEAPAAEAAEATAEATEAPAAETVEVAPLKVGLLGTSVKPVGVIVAKALGYFEEEGVEVEFETVSSMNDAYLAVANGDLDVYLFSSTAAATFISQGTTTLRVFGGTAAEGSEIMAAKGSDNKIDGTIDCLLGKTIAVQMPETGQMVLKNWIIEQGYTYGDPSEGEFDVYMVYVSDAQTMLEGCKSGEYDMCITNSCMGYYADANGMDLLGGVKDFVPTYPCCRQTCNQSTYENNLEGLVRFEIAALRGYEYYLNNQEETLDILCEYAPEADRDFLQAQVYGTDTYTPAMRLSLDPDKQACVAFYEAMENIGGIEDNDIDWNEYVVTDVYGSALQTLMEREPDNTLWTELNDYFVAHD